MSIVLTRFNAVFLLFSLVTVGCLSGASMAQEAPGALTLEEVVVTARRIEENLQTVPMAVSAYTGEELELRGAVDLVDLGVAAPNVDIQAGSNSISGFSSAPLVFIRGIGQTDFLIVSDQAVGVYLDGVYLARGIGSLLDLVDLERAEVLRGPQGTLFGRNSIGGAINLVSKQPTNEFDATLKLTLGENSRQDIEAMVNGPLTETLSGRLSVLRREREGYVRALQYDDLWLGGDGVTVARGQLRFQPTETFTLDIAADLSREKESPAAQVPLLLGGPGPHFAGNNPGLDARLYNENRGGVPGLSTNPALCGSVSRAELAVGAFPPSDPACYGPYWVPDDLYASHAVYTDTLGNRIENPEQKLDTNGASVTFTWDVGPGTLKGIFAYRDFDASFVNDNDLAPMVIIHNNHFDYFADQRSQELQYTASLADDRVRLTAGLYSFDEQGTEILSFARSRSLDWACCGNGGQMAMSAGTYEFNRAPRIIDNRSDAFYVQATWDIGERLHLTAGARRTEEEKDYETSLDWPGTFRTQTVTSFTSETETTPMLSLGFDAADSVLLYGTYSEGFRTGGFPARVTQFISPLPTFDSEFAQTLEAGVKSDLWNDRMRLNVAAFTNSYTDMQLTANPLGAPPDVVGSAVENLGDSTINGLELEILASLSENFRLDFTAGWLDAGFDCLVVVDENFDRAGCNTTQRLQAGADTVTVDSPLPRTPDWNFNVGGTFRIPLANGGDLTGRVNWKRTDSFWQRATTPPLEFNEGYELVNASLTYAPNQGDWSVMIGGTNLTDELYYTSRRHGSTNTKAVIARPRHLYASLRYNFGAGAR